MSKRDRIHISEEYHDIKGCAPIFWTLVAIALFWLAVEDWLRSCNTRGVAPSAILAPLANEAQYAQLRLTM